MAEYSNSYMPENRSLTLAALCRACTQSLHDPRLTTGDENERSLALRCANRSLTVAALCNACTQSRDREGAVATTNCPSRDDRTSSAHIKGPDYFKGRWYEKAGLPAGCVKLPTCALDEVQKGDRLMKKDTTAKKNQKALSKSEKKQIRKMAAQQRLTIGLDLGDRNSRYCILDEAGAVASEGSLPTTKTGLDSLFEKMPSSRVALEVGTHSPWVSRHLAQWGHEVIVANPHKVKLITQSVRKNDRIDARQLARLARVDPKLLSPIRHRGEQAQADLAVIRARAELVEARTALINWARGLAKPMGERLKACDADQVGPELGEAGRGGANGHPAAAEERGGDHATDRGVRSADRADRETVSGDEVTDAGLRSGDADRVDVHADDRGCGAVRAQPGRGSVSGAAAEATGQRGEPAGTGDQQGGGWADAAAVGASGAVHLRRGAPDSDLRAWGLSKAERGGKNAKRRAVVAMARKLAVLLHRLWVTGEVYDPQYNRKRAQAKRIQRCRQRHEKRLERLLSAGTKAPSWGDCEVAADWREPAWLSSGRY